MSIFLLRKPDNTESLAFIKNATTLESAYSILQKSESLKGYGITVAVPSIDMLDAWESILKKCGFPDLDDRLAGLSGEERLQAVIETAKDNTLIAKQYAYNYKASTKLNDTAFTGLQSRVLVDQVKREVEDGLDHYYDAVSNNTKIGKDSSGHVKMVLNGRITLNYDMPVESLRDQLIKITSDKLLKVNLKIDDIPEVTVTRANMDGTELKLKRNVRFRF